MVLGRMLFAVAWSLPCFELAVVTSCVADGCEIGAITGQRVALLRFRGSARIPRLVSVLQ